MSEQNFEAQQPEENQDRPEWLPDNFKSPEDLANSYKELQGEFTRTRQQNKQYEDRLSQLEEMVASQAEQPQQLDQSQMQASQDQLYAAYEQDPVATMAWLAQQAAQSVYQQSQQQNQPDPRQLEAQAQMTGHFAEQAIKARYSDWDAHREQVAEEIQNNPDLYPEDLFHTPAGTEKAFDRAYKAVKLTALESESDQSLEERIAAQRQAKQQAQTLSGQSGRPAPVDDMEARWEQIMNAPSRSYSDLMRPQR